MDEPHLTREQLAERWNVKVSTLNQWRWNGKGPVYFKIGKTIYYGSHDIRAFEISKRRRSTSDLPIPSPEETAEPGDTTPQNPYPFLSALTKKGGKVR